MLGWFVCVGGLGLFGMTWFFPLLAVLFSRSSSKREATVSEGVVRIDILIPAHNEESVIDSTLQSILDSVTEAGDLVSARVIVGADRCTDATAEVSRRSGASVVELGDVGDDRSSRNKGSKGKWNTLRALILGSFGDAVRQFGVERELAHESGRRPDWIVLADAGVIWPKGLIARLVPLFHNMDVLGVAPTYRNPGGGVTERIVWGIERHFKSLENLAGGPVSIHGATVAYRAHELVTALDELGNRGWLNDDVVLPLTLRGLFPKGEIRYLPDVGVYDQPTLKEQEKGRREFGRRRRMVLGNIQWVKRLYLKALWRNPLSGLPVSRRIFRMLWAYWVVCLGGAFVVLGSLVSVLVTILFLAIVAIGLAATRSGRSLCDAAVASLLSPYLFLRSFFSEEAAWT